MTDPAELDAAPAEWRAWWRWRSQDGWTRHERPDPPTQPPAPTRRLRGSQAEPGHHLGRGTRWQKG